MTPSAALALSLLTLAVPAPPPAPPFDGLGAAPAAPPPVELVDADGKVFGALVSFGAPGWGAPGTGFFVATGGRLFAMSQTSIMTPDGGIQTSYGNEYSLYWATPDCSGPAYGYTMMWGAFPEGFVEATARFPDGWHVIRQTSTTGSFYSGSYLDLWSPSPACTSFTYEWPTTMNAIEDLGPAPAFRSPLHPRVNVP